MGRGYRIAGQTDGRRPGSEGGRRQMGLRTVGREAGDGDGGWEWCWRFEVL